MAMTDTAVELVNLFGHIQVPKGHEAAAEFIVQQLPQACQPWRCQADAIASDLRVLHASNAAGVRHLGDFKGKLAALRRIALEWSGWCHCHVQMHA